jgi:hypothetical protein
MGTSVSPWLQGYAQPTSGVYGIMFALQNCLSVDLYGFGLDSRHGRAVQVDPIKSKLKAHGTKRLKLEYVTSISILLQFCFNFAVKFNLHRYTTASATTTTARGATRRWWTAVTWSTASCVRWCGRGWWQVLTLVHFSAQPEPLVTQ